MAVVLHICINVDQKSSAGVGFEMDINRKIIVSVALLLKSNLYLDNTCRFFDKYYL